MKFDIYIFDLDGTLLNLGDMRSYVDLILQKTLKKLKAPNIPEKNERSQFWGSGDKYIELLSKWGVLKPQKFWKQYDKVDFKHRRILVPQNKIALFDDVKNVLDKIYNHKDGKKLAIVSNTSDYVVEYILEKFNISSFFQDFFSMGFKIDEEFAKPSPHGILSILKKLHYDQDTHRAIMIGDSMSDIIAAKRANISACLIKRNTLRHRKRINEWEFQPDYIIEGLDEILKL
ncbi:MAG: HAD family hydrolase [Promethearchaeota archaeon]